MNRGKIGRSSPENGAWHAARWVTVTFRLEAVFNTCLGYGVSCNGGFFLCHHAFGQRLNAHECNLCSSRGAPGSTGRYRGLHRHRPPSGTALPSPPGAIGEGTGGRRGDQEPGHSSLPVLALAPLWSRAGHGGGGTQWPEPRPMEMGRVGAQAGAIRQRWGRGTAFGEDSQAPEA